MIQTTLILLAISAPPPVEKSESLEQLWIGQLEVGQRLLIQTEKRTYRVEIVNPRSGAARTEVSRDGQNFSSPTKVYFLGSTTGRYPEMLVTMGQLQTGLRIELGLGTLDQADRALTSPVTSIRRIAL